MSGTLTPAAPSCIIADGGSSCNVTLNWTTTNPVATSAVTSNWPSANTTVASGNSGSTSAQVPYSSRTFYLYNNAVQLATSNATSSCATGSTWTAGVCKGPMSGTLTPAAPSCIIADGGSSCNVTLNWTTTNPVATSAVTSNWPSANTTVASGNSGSTSAQVPYSSRTFYLYNNAVQLATSNATSSCATGSTWTAGVCKGPMSGTLTPAAPSCIIADGGSSCNVTLNWTTTNPVATSAVTSNWPSANTTVASGNSGSTSAQVPYSSRTFYLYNNAVQLATSNATSSCATGSTWTAGVCKGPMSGTLRRRRLRASSRTAAAAATSL